MQSRADSSAPDWYHEIQAGYSAPNVLRAFPTQKRYCLSVTELQLLFEKRRNEMRDEVIGAHTTVAASGFIGTFLESVLTSEKALELGRMKSAADASRREQQHRKDVATSLKGTRRAEAFRESSARFHFSCNERRAALAGLPVENYIRIVTVGGAVRYISAAHG